MHKIILYSINLMYGPLSRHSFVESHPSMQITEELITKFSPLAELNKEVVALHRQNRFGLLVGDDVSARVPALVTHQFLRLAQADNRIDSVPETHFMTSGSLPNDQEDHSALEATWQENLAEHAGMLLGRVASQDVLIITEIDDMEGSTSLSRLKGAFIAHGARVTYKATNTLYLGDQGVLPEERGYVGLTKQRGEATSQPLPNLDAEKVRALRGFLRDYTSALYIRAYGHSRRVRKKRTEVIPNPGAESRWRFGI